MNNILYKEITSSTFEPKKKSFLKSKFKWLLIVLILLYAIAFFTIEFIYIPTTSMTPTLPPQTIYLCNKVHKWTKLKRGDIVTFKTKENDNVLKGKEIVKRIIGLPYDEINIDSQGNVYINNKLTSEFYVKQHGGKTNLHFTVPANCYFLLGDNREVSFDGRYWRNPYLKRNKIISKVETKICNIKY